MRRGILVSLFLQIASGLLGVAFAAEGQRPCQLQFTHERLCASVVWHKYPTRENTGEVELGFWRMNDPEQRLVDPSDRLGVVLWSPEERLPSAPVTIGRITGGMDGDEYPGRYLVSNVWFFRPGQWELRVYFTRSTRGHDVVVDKAKVDLMIEQNDIADGPEAESRAELATILGAPDNSLPFVKNLVRWRVPLLDEGSGYERDWTTGLYSLLASAGVHSTVSYEVIDESGSASMPPVFEALKRAVLSAPVVFTALGGTNETTNDICGFLASRSDTAFVLAAGASGLEQREGDEPNCMSRNIVRVGALNSQGKALLVRSNFGRTIRIAAPGENISVTVGSGKQASYSGTSVAAAQVAGELAVFATNHVELHGVDLVEAFLTERTERLPELEGKIEGARALKPHFTAR